MSHIVMFLENHIENVTTAFIKLILAMLIKDLNRKFPADQLVRRYLMIIFLAVQWMQRVGQKCIFNLIWSVPSSLLNPRNHQGEPDFHGESSYDSYHMSHMVWVVFGNQIQCNFLEDLNHAVSWHTQHGKIRTKKMKIVIQLVATMEMDNSAHTSAKRCLSSHPG